MKVFLDDIRETPTGWHRTFTVAETITCLESRQVTHLSVDNDLGEGLVEGYEVLNWLEEAIYTDKTFPIPVIIVHSDNSSRMLCMKKAIGSITRIRKTQLGEAT